MPSVERADASLRCAASSGRGTDSCSLVTWSKAGLIAFAPRRDEVFSTFIECTDGQEWALSKPQPLEDVNRIHSGLQIKYLSWSPHGVELAVIDAAGGISIHMHNGILNELSCIYQLVLPTAGDADAVVGFQWLNSKKVILISNPAIRQDDSQFHYGIHRISPYGPWHPQAGNSSSNKQACVGVTRNGKLRLWYQQDMRYNEVVSDLETELGPDEYYTLAAFGADRDNTLVLAAYSRPRHCLKLFRISILWSTRPPVTGQDGDVAIVQVRRLFCNEAYCPKNNKRGLTHLEVLSPSNHPESRLVVLAAYSSPDGTTIQKIEVTNLPLTLHSNFHALGLRRNPVPEDPSDIVQFQEYFDVNKQLIGLKSLHSESTVCCSYADGSIEMRERSNFTEHVPSLDNQSVNSLYSAGFAFPETEPALEICMSPNFVAFVLLDTDGELSLHYMKPVLIGDNDDASTLAAVALALRHTIACYNNICCDDIMLIATNESQVRRGDFAVSLLQQCHKAIGFSLDLPKDVQADKFLVLLSLQRLLSLQSSLGARKGWSRTASGTVAWATLNLRLFAFALTFTLKATHQKQAGQADNEVRGDTLITLLGLSKWCVDFLAFLLQDIFELGRNPERFLAPGSSSVALVMLLGAVPRLLIRYTLRGLRGLEQLVSRSASKEADVLGMSRMAFKQLEEILKSGPVQIASFEKLVSDVETFMRNGTRADAAERLNTEQALFFKAQVPPELHPVIHRIRSVFLQRIKPEIDIPTLYFYPTTWLGLDGHEILESSIELDGLRKQIMPRNTDTRRKCVRCGSISSLEDSNRAFTKYPSQWTVAFQRNCICGSAWVKTKCR